MYSTYLFEGTNIDVPHRYENLEYQGFGAQGIVMKAFDTQTQQNVAIKKLTRPFAHPLSAKRTFREFVILNLINHQNVVKLLNLYTPQNDNINEFSDVYLVMELMDGNLSTFSLQNYDQEHLSFLMYQMLCGVNHLHKSGIIHRDLKPSNIGFRANASIKLLDFGLACAENSASLTGYVTTRHYRAPEIILGAGYKANADVWSLGCIFAELITKTILFPGTNHVDQWTKIISIVGTPNSSFYETLTDTTKAYLNSLPKYSAKSWESLLPDSLFPSWEKDSELTAANARDLISKMLVIDPKQRINVRDAINHPYVKLWYKASEVDGLASPSYDITIDDIEHDVETWKRLIFNQIQTWQ
uniref:Stress-activated protein kinase JNK n=1 Tax=Panagrolaimus superbus TaxID=310955 RepID=A0A914YMB6_9BILA